MSEEETTSVVGDFQLLEQINEGAMGSMFKAQQISTDRLCALKVLPQAMAADPLYLQMFRQEEQTLRTLRHSNLVEFICYGEYRGLLYCVMEFIEGESLSVRLNRRKKFSVPEALGVGIQTARGLEYAWMKQRLIHRDIKPANLILRNDGVIKIIDFGFAGQRSHLTSASADTGVVGTPHFLSPEQVRGQSDLDCRADMYALGVTLFNLVTGQHPYDGETVEAVMRMHLDAPVPDPRTIDRMLPKEVSLLIQRMMAKDRNQRHVTYAELIANMKQISDPCAKTSKFVTFLAHK